MELSGEERIAASRESVWQALHDADVLKECIKGCKSLEWVEGGVMRAVVEAKVGPVKATFDAVIEITNSVTPERYTLTGEGKGGVAGFAKGSADVALADDGDATILTYTANAKIGGKLAQLGSRLVDTTAKSYARDFFACLSERVAADNASPDAPAAAASASPEPVPAEPAPAEIAPAEAVPPAGATTATPEATPPAGPAAAPVEAAATEVDLAQRTTAIDAPHAEDTVEERLEAEAVRGTWGGPWMWGILAFAVVILVLIALR